MYAYEYDRGSANFNVEYFANHIRIARYYPIQNCLKVYFRDDYGNVGGDIRDSRDFFYEFCNCSDKMKLRYHTNMKLLLGYLSKTNLEYLNKIEMKYISTSFVKDKIGMVRCLLAYFIKSKRKQNENYTQKRSPGSTGID